MTLLDYRITDIVDLVMSQVEDRLDGFHANLRTATGVIRPGQVVGGVTPPAAFRAHREASPIDHPLGSVTGDHLADLAVTGAKIAAATIPLGKLSPAGATTGYVISWNGSSIVWAQISGTDVDGTPTTGPFVPINGNVRMTGPMYSGDSDHPLAQTNWLMRAAGTATKNIDAANANVAADAVSIQAIGRTAVVAIGMGPTGNVDGTEGLGGEFRGEFGGQFYGNGAVGAAITATGIDGALAANLVGDVRISTKLVLDDGTGSLAATYTIGSTLAYWSYNDNEPWIETDQQVQINNVLYVEGAISTGNDIISGGNVAASGDLSGSSALLRGNVVLDDGVGLGSHTVGTSVAFFGYAPDEGYITTDSYLEVLGGLYAASINAGSAYFSSQTTIDGALAVRAAGTGGDGFPLATPTIYAGNPSNSAKWVGIGYSDALDAGFITSVHHLNAWKPLLLAPVGGVVVVGKTTSSRSSGDLDVAGNVYAANVYAANIPAGTLAALGAAQTWTQPQTFTITDAGTSNVTTAHTLVRGTSGTPSPGFGVRLAFQAKAGTTNGQPVAAVDAMWTEATDASRTGALQFSVFWYGGVQRGMEVAADPAGVKLAFYGQPAVARPAAYTQTYATATRTHAAPTATAVATTAATTTTPYGYSTSAQADAIVAALNALVADMANVKQVLNSVIDDQQANGLLA